MLVPHVTRKLRKLIKSLNEPASVVSYSLNIFPSLGLMVIQRTFSGTYFRGVRRLGDSSGKYRLGLTIKSACFKEGAY